MSATKRESDFRVLRLLSLWIVACLVGCGPDSPNPPSKDADPKPDKPPVTANSPTETSQSSQVSATAPPAPAAQDTASATTVVPGMKKMDFPAAKDMKFQDKLESNVEFTKTISELAFTATDGSKIKLADYENKQNVILVFTEGFNGMLCPFCTTQTSRLIANYDKFKQRDCEIIVVYPGPDDKVDDFVEAATKTEKEQVDQVPFPIVLDQEFMATDFFNIHSKHAHPSTYLIDKQGNVKFAYVGTDMTADRPSVKALLSRLDQLQ